MKHSFVLVAALLMIISLVHSTAGQAQVKHDGEALRAQRRLPLEVQEADTANLPECNPMRFGIKGGFNFSNLNLDGGGPSGVSTGFNLGLYGKLQLCSHLSFQPELYFSTKGGQVTYHNELAEGTARFDLSYLEMPLLAVLNITENLDVMAGPYAAFLINDKVTNMSSADHFDFKNNIEHSDFNSFDAGVAVGAALNVAGFGLGVRYDYGLTQIRRAKTYAGKSGCLPNATNGALSLYLSISLN